MTKAASDHRDMQDFSIDRSRYDEANPDRSVFTAEPGVTRKLVLEISRQKSEPEWMREKRLAAFDLYLATPLPHWGPSLGKLDLNKIVYYVRPDAKESTSWDDVPAEIKKTFDRIGIPEAERKSLSGVGVQYDSDVVYHSLKKEWEDKGVIFENMDVAVQKYPELVRKYFMTQCVPINDHKFVMLHAAVWSGGTFIYVPPGVKVDIPLQAYFRMNAMRGGQFEHTLIIADKGSEVHYIEGCSAPQYAESALHAGCVELFVHDGARIRYSSVENWSRNTFNLNTKRAIVDADGVVEWVNGNLGCLTGDSKIFTNPKGPARIKDIEAGDKVYVWDSTTNSLQKSKVKAKIFSGYKEVYKLEAGGREIEASANHPFLTLVRKKGAPFHKKGFFQFEWKPLAELKDGDVVGIAKKLPLGEGRPYRLPRLSAGKDVVSCNQYESFKIHTGHLYNKDIVIPDETNEDFMWLMGLLLGDGHVDLKQNKINIATHESEDYRGHLCDVLSKLFGYTVTEKKQRYIIINSKTLCELYSQIGFGGNADSKKIPEWVFTLPEKQILAFLAGYFDADGHSAVNSIAFTSINKNILSDVKLLGIALGFGVSRIFQHGKAGNVVIAGKNAVARDSWRILFNGKRIYDLPVRCLRKKERIRRIRTRRNYVSSRGLNFKSKANDEIGFARIESITPMGIKPTFDIEVEKYHNFVSNGLIVHNSGCTMLYPCSVLRGEGARSDSLGIAFAASGQNQDTGSKVIHAAKNTSSTIRAKSISKSGGITSYRGLVRVAPKATGTTSSVSCDALLIGSNAISNTYPFMKIDTNKADIAHEASVGRIGEEEIFYLQSRGLSGEEAVKMIVSGFIEPIVKALPLEYAVELNKLIELEMEGSVG